MSSADAVSNIKVTDFVIKDSVTYYNILIKTFLRQWTVSRRYSQFEALHAGFLKMFPDHPPPASLPPKHLNLISNFLFRHEVDKEQLEERRLSLEAYLKAILINEDSRWRESQEWMHFLQYPLTRELSFASPSEKYTMASWMSQFSGQQSQVASIRQQIRNRESAALKCDTSKVHQITSNARKIADDVMKELKNLEKWVEDAGSKKQILDGERTRRSDLVNGLATEVKNLKKLLDKPVEYGAKRITETKRISASMPVEVRPQSRRVFGNIVAQETDETRKFDDMQLAGFQMEQIRRQDYQVEELSKVISRQKAIGLQINEELMMHNNMLDDLATDVDRVGSKIKVANKQMGKLHRM